MSETATPAAGPLPLRALQLVNHVRRVRSELKMRIAKGQISAAEVIRTCPSEAASMPVAQLLASQRGWGETRSRAFLMQVALRDGKSMGSLTERQRRAVVSLLTRTGIGLEVRVLDLDPDLGSGVDPEDWELARHACRGQLLRVPRGVWDLPPQFGQQDELFGLVIVEGLLCREVALRDRYMFELLGPADVLQPPVVGGRPRLGGAITLTAAADTTLIVLGKSFIQAAGRWPALLTTVGRRLEARREHLAIQGLIAHLPRAEHRVLLTLWHLADRWGRVTREGTLLALPLTHELLGHLAAARRSTATLAVNALESAGYIRRFSDGSWLLTAAAAQRVQAIATVSRTAGVLGETFVLRNGSGR
jgi:CRP/FNR family transcriptional regulator, cyclic AMP receptor protein